MVRSWKMFWGSIAKAISLVYIALSGANVMAEQFVAGQIPDDYDIEGNQAKLAKLGFYIE